MELTRGQLLHITESCFQAAVETIEKTVKLTAKQKERIKEDANKRSARYHALSIGLKPNKDSRAQVRSLLNETIIRTVKSKKITHSDLSTCVQTSRPRITKLLNRRTKQFTIDAMIKILDTLGVTIKIEFTNS